ncbi:transcription initiation at TATA-containing promoter protein [Diplodia intermedia]|uniref:Transcription initiation at TATA-containing promoter protein n=1 Tax=Diplodia intermedia TaxID=856260 RepID=A0ABR3U1G2_9PEZI
MDKPSVEPKPVPSADAMALDANINGSANEHDPLFDEDPAPHHVDIPAPDADAPSDALPTPATNGADSVNGADSHPDQDPFADPITDVDSGIAPTAPFVPDQPPEQAPLSAAPENLAPTSLPPAIEPATSDVREDSASLPQTSAPAIKPEGAIDASEDPAAPVPAQPSASPPRDTEDKEDKMDGGVQAQPATTDASASADAQKSDEPTDPVPPPPPAQDALQTPAAAAQDPPAAQDSAVAQSSSAAPAATAAADQEMTDAPSANKTRPREDDDDDDDDGPLAKRVRTADGSMESTAGGEAKQKQHPAPPVTNGDVRIPPTSDIAVAPAAISNAPEKKKFDSQPLTAAQHKFLMDRLRGAKKTKPAAAFLQPVDPVALNIPHYPQIIAKPMDLSTLETKHKEKRYQSVDAFMGDFYLMIDNCVIFNGPQHPIAQSAWNLQMWFERGMHLIPGREAPVEITKKPKKSGSVKPPRRESRPNIPVHSPTNSTSNNATFALQADGTPLIRRDSSTGDGRPKREIHRPPPKDLPYSNPRPKNKKSQLELKFAETVINEMLKPKHREFSYPFLQPVDPVALNIPQYLKIIRKPMDLGTVYGRFKRGEYTSAKDIKADLDLIFANCYKFNPEGDDVNKMGKMLEEVYRKAWDKKSEWMDEHAPASEPASASEDEEDDDSEEEDDEEEIRRRQAQIAEQIMLLTQEQLALQAKKGKSPKVAAKKTSKKDKSQAKSKKPSKPSIPAKPKKKMRQISFEEKRLISETISNLDEVQMAKAVQIIRNGVPALQGVNDDELELDIDTIPNDVLHDLLKYIKTVNPAATAATAALPTYDDDYEPPSRKNTAAQPRKNKPMGKHEQEQAIAEIKQRLQNFNNRGSSSDQSPEPVQTTHRDESSDDESSASESEEE